MNRQIRDQILNAIIRGVQRNGDRIFSISQDTASCFVPRDSGMLAHSGVPNKLVNGFEISYNAPYALVVEVGIPRDIPITGTQIIHMKNGKTRTLHNKRVIFIRRKRLSKFSWIDLFRTDSKGKKQQGIFVTIDKIKARPGQYYLGRAVLEGIKELPDDIIKELKLERNLIVK